MRYVSWYDDETYLKAGKVVDPQELVARSQALREYGVTPIGETWVKGYGTTVEWEGPALDRDTQNLLNLREKDD